METTGKTITIRDITDTENYNNDNDYMYNPQGTLIFNKCLSCIQQIQVQENKSSI